MNWFLYFAALAGIVIWLHFGFRSAQRIRDNRWLHDDHRVSLSFRRLMWTVVPGVLALLVLIILSAVEAGREDRQDRAERCAKRNMESVDGLFRGKECRDPQTGAIYRFD